MILQRFYDEKLAQASYLVGCAATGEALIVDANRDVRQYIDAAARQNLRITHVTETHIHADYLSGLRELCAATGATAYLSGEGGPDWQYGFAAADGAEILRDGDTFMVGNIRIGALHTPGHTPEHMSFVVTDTAGADEPMGVFTGDFIFAGDVGRPDLLEKAAGIANTMDAAARMLFRSLQKFAQLPDYLQLWPGHGAGSACGKALGAVPQTTLGYEKRFNWAFSHADEESFVKAVLDGQPDAPVYFAQMKRLNRDGPPVLGSRTEPPMLAASQRDTGAMLVDIRPWSDFSRGHIENAINIPHNKSFITWAGWLIPYDRDIQLVASSPGTAHAAARDLALIGLDRVTGFMVHDPANAAGVRAMQPDTDAHATAAALDDSSTTIIDVRNDDEWNAGHVPTDRNARVLHIPLAQLAARIDEVPADGRVIVHCKAGARSAMAAGILDGAGRTNVENMKGGFDAWRAAGLATEQ